MAKFVRVLGLSCVMMLGGVSGAFAQLADPADPPAADSAAPAEAPPEPGAGQEIPWQPGPKAIELGHGAKLDLPDSHAFLAQPDAGKLMEKMGNLYNDDLLGLVVSKNE